MIYCCSRLFYLIGPTFLVCLAILAVLTKIDRRVNRFLVDKRTKVQKMKEERLNVTKEIFENIRVIKMFAWEDHFKGKILSLREQEIKLGQNVHIYSTFLSFLWNFVPNLFSAISFSIYIWIGSTNARLMLRMDKELELSVAMEVLMLFLWVRFTIIRLVD